MKNNWDKLFGKKDFSYYSKSYNLKKYDNNFLNSFNQAKVIYPELNKQKFRKILKFIEKIIKLKKKSSLLDFGSGNGCFLNFFIKKFALKNNISLEVSKNLIDLQKRELKFTKFIKTNSKEFKIDKIKDFKVNASICLSCFQYFKSYRYARKVIEFLLRVSKNVILIYDIKDFNKKKHYRDSVRLRQNLTKREFFKKYKNFPLRYYKRSFFSDILSKNKHKKTFKYYFLSLPNSATDNKYGYCLIILRKKI